MNRQSQAPIPTAWRDSVERYHDRVAIRRQGRIAEAERMRLIDEIERNENASMSPFGDRRGRRNRETEQ